MSLEVELETDLFHVSYDPKKLTLQRILKTIQKEGFQAEVTSRTMVVPSGVARGAPRPPLARSTGARMDLKGLPEDLRQSFGRARREKKQLLVVFHGPG